MASSSSATITNLSANVTQAVYGQAVSSPVALIANVSSSSTTGYPPGTVSFYMDGGSTPIGTATLTAYNGQWTAKYDPSNLPVGSHTFTAVYNGGTSGSTTFPFQQLERAALDRRCRFHDHQCQPPASVSPRSGNR